jgi:O-antigen ligase
MDLSQIVRMTQEVTTRLEQRYPVELFGIFSWGNVKMQLIPWCVYPLGAVVAVACRNSWITKAMLLAGAALAVYVAGAFLTRTVFLSGGIAIAVAILLFMIKADRKRQFMMVTIIVLLFLGVLELIHVIPAVHDSFAGLLDRFADTADDSRKYLWESSAKLMVQHPMGGGDALLEDHLWAHNLPLDMGLLYGIPGFLCMSWLLIMLIHAVVQWAGRLASAIKSFEVLLLCTFIGAFVSCLVCPPDIAFLMPMLLVAAFAKERVWIAYSRTVAIRRTGSLAVPGPTEEYGIITQHHR